MTSSYAGGRVWGGSGTISFGEQRRGRGAAQFVAEGILKSGKDGWQGYFRVVRVQLIRVGGGGGRRLVNVPICLFKTNLFGVGGGGRGKGPLFGTGDDTAVGIGSGGARARHASGRIRAVKRNERILSGNKGSGHYCRGGGLLIDNEGDVVCLWIGAAGRNVSKTRQKMSLSLAPVEEVTEK
jgi:hypothetical protein